MNIAFLVTKDLLGGGGGIEKYTREVGRRLVARGHTVLVYSTRGSEPGPEQWQGIKIKWMPRIRPHWAEKTAGALNATAWALASGEFHALRPKGFCPDLLHLHSVAAGAMAPLLRLSRVPCVLQMHGVEWQRSRWGLAARTTLRLLESVAFASATAVTAVSKSQCEFYSARYHAPVSFIPTGTQILDPLPPTHLADLGLAPFRYFFTAVRLVPEKGIHYLVRAFRRTVSEWQLVIAGGEAGDNAYVRHLRELAGGDPRIRFLGHVADPLLSELYSNAGVYVQASEMEGMAISLLDAMSHGCCCIVSDIPENLDAIGDTGIAFRSTNVDDLAAKMTSMVQSGHVARAFGERARERARSQFSWDAVTTQLENLYLETRRCAAIESQIRNLSYHH